MASVKDTATFFAEGTHTQFEHVLTLYPEALRIKAENHKSKKPEELIKLDNWYQNELPKKIKARGKDGHLTHEELCQTMKWKQIRGKFYPQLSYLVKVNTPRAVMAETKKAFKKLPNLEQAITALSNLKGVGTTMASALLAAASPEHAPFMADECLMAIPEIEGIDYTTKEYLNFVQHIQNTVTRLNKQNTNGTTWSPHRVELALWTHYIASEMKPELLEGIPDANGSAAAAAAPATENGNSHVISNGEPPSDDSNQDLATATPTVVATVQANGKSTEKDDEASQPAAALDENSTTTSFTEDSLDKPSTPSSNNVSTTAATPPAALVTATATETPVVQVNNAVAATVNEDTNDSAPTNDDDNSSTARPTDESEAGTEEDSSQDSVQEPPTKKSKK